MKLNTLIMRYSFFAILATLVNLIVQRGIFWFNDSSVIFAFAVFSGTMAGLVVKYALENVVFNDKAPVSRVIVKNFRSILRWVCNDKFLGF